MKNQFSFIATLLTAMSTIIYGTWTIAQLDKRLAIANFVNQEQTKQLDSIINRLNKTEDKIEHLYEVIHYEKQSS